MFCEGHFWVKLSTRRLCATCFKGGGVGLMVLLQRRTELVMELQAGATSRSLQLPW